MPKPPRGMDPLVPEATKGQVPEQALLTGYQVLASRYASTTAFQWQVPAFGLTAEAALLAAILGTPNHTSALVLAAVSVVVAVGAVAITRRVELTAWWDRAMLDRFEAELLPEDMRLRHNLNLRQRLREEPFDLGKGSRSLEWQLRIVMLAHPSLILSILLIAVSCASVATAFSS